MNNAAIVIKVNKLEEIPGMDKIQLAKLFGTQVIVGKDIKIGDILVYVDSNMKMSPEFLKTNNLYRHPEQNADNTKTGYFGDDGRVKCIKMRGEISDGFLFPPEYLSHFGIINENKFKKGNPLEIGREFNTYGSSLICEKYILIQKQPGSGNKKANSGRKAFSAPMFVEHFDTSQFMRNKHRIPEQTICYIEEKIHGTSHRTGRVKVDTWSTMSWWDRLLVHLSFRYLPKDYQYLNGTRRVVHTPNVQKSPYHDNTMREEVLEHLRAQKLFKGEQLYMELFGYEKTSKHIQKDFPYGCEQGEYKNLLYRITMNNEDGRVVDYSREYVYNRAEELGLEKPHLFEKVYYSGTKRSMELLEEKVVNYAQGQSEHAEDTLKEGVCIWYIDSYGQWTCLKYKSDKFRLQASEGGNIDIEDIS